MARNTAFQKMRKFLTEIKVCLKRSMSYVAIINSGMILFLMLSRLKEFGIDIQLTHWYFPLFIISIFGAVAIGHLDIKLGFFSEEHNAVTKRNPIFTDIQDRLERIENKLNKSKQR